MNQAECACPAIHGIPWLVHSTCCRNSLSCLVQGSLGFFWTVLHRRVKPEAMLGKGSVVEGWKEIKSLSAKANHKMMHLYLSHSEGIQETKCCSIKLVLIEYTQFICNVHSRCLLQPNISCSDQVQIQAACSWSFLRVFFLLASPSHSFWWSRTDSWELLLCH